MKALLTTIVICLSLIMAQKADQCDPDKQTNICLGQTPAGFNYLKSYPVKANNESRTVFSYVLTKGTSYVLSICDEGKKALSVSVLDSHRNKVADSVFRSEEH